jgi:hydroxymethylpyrimidine pyrophosphatase-like HAD family hydrolase
MVLFSQVLPLGASKDAGVSWLLHHLGMDPAGLLALGEREKDIEMLQLPALVSQVLFFVYLLLHLRMMLCLQVLPLGASKSAGASLLLDHLGMDPAGPLA